MSFILEALKKSEAERQRAASPGLVTVTPVASRQTARWWIAGLLTLLAVNLLLLAFMLWRGVTRSAAAAPASPPSVPAETQASRPSVDSTARSKGTARLPEAPASAQSGLAAPETAPAAPVYAPEIPLLASAHPRVAASEPEATPAPSAMRATERAVSSSPPRVARAAPANESEENLPSLEEINAGSAQKIPDLHMDIHVYAQRPVERFVFINNHKYREGAVLAEGPTVERITRESVILNYNNVRFSLPRQ